MSTRSSVGFQTGDTWKGRYVHSDGYPTYLGHVLQLLVQRDGVEAVTKRITEDRYGWSNLNPDQPDTSSVVIDPAATYGTYAFGTPEYEAWNLTKGSYSDGRFAGEAGYGVAYTEVGGQSDPDGWVTPEEDWGTEWAYLLTPKGIVVLAQCWAPVASYWHLVGAVAYDAPETAWAVAEAAGNKAAEEFYESNQPREVTAR